jgi:thiol-disulfide isomerase/thioredoxin
MGAMLWASAGDVVKVTGKNTLIFTWNVKAPAPENKVWRTYLNDSRELWDEYQTNAIKQRSLRTLQRSVPTEDIQLLNQQYDSLDVENNKLQVQINENLIRRMKQMAIDDIWLQKLHDLALTSNYIPDFPLEQKEATIELYNLLTEEQKQHPLAKEAYAMLFPPQHVEVGKEMADADLYDLQGGKHNLAELKGKYILLDFWSRGCGPCILAIPEMGELASIYKDKLNIVSISTDNKKMWEEASEAHPMSWNNWNDLNGTAGLYANYDQGAIPAYTLISPEGIVLEQWVGYGEGSLKFKLATLIK